MGEFSNTQWIPLLPTLVSTLSGPCVSTVLTNNLSATWGWWTWRSAAAVSNVAILVGILSEVTLVATGATARCTAVTAKYVREIGGSVVLVHAVGVHPSVALVQIGRRESVAEFIYGTVDGETVECYAYNR